MNINDMLKEELRKAQDGILGMAVNTATNQLISSMSANLAELPLKVSAGADADLLMKNLKATAAWQQVNANIVAQEIAAQAWSNLIIRILATALVSTL